MRIAMITAMTEETLPILKKLGNVVDESTIAGVTIRKIQYEDDIIYLATSGIGEIRAALTVQLLKDLFDIDVVMNFGFVGALNNSLSIGELVIVEKVCHYQFDLSSIDGTKIGQYNDKDDIYLYTNETFNKGILENIGKPMKKVTAASADKFIGTKEDKIYLKNEFKCDICEMELAGLCIATEKNNIPLISIKVVSDKADESAHEDFSVVVKNGIVKYEEVLPNIIAAVKGNIKHLPPIRR